jgi:hypothetical protein
MDNNIILPRDLQTIVDSEKVDFSLLSKRSEPLQRVALYILVGIFLTGIMAFILNKMLVPILDGGEHQIVINGEDKTVSLDNFQPLIFPVCIELLFFYTGIALFINGVKVIFQTGGFYVGTPDRLIRYYRGKVNSYDWEQFSGVITTKSRQITLDLKTGRMETRKNNSTTVFVPDTIFMSGIKNVVEIEKICKMRIKENAPSA